MLHHLINRYNTHLLKHPVNAVPWQVSGGIYPCPEVRDEPAAVPGADNVRRRHGIPLLGALPPDSTGETAWRTRVASPCLSSSPSGVHLAFTILHHLINRFNTQLLKYLGNVCPRPVWGWPFAGRWHRPQAAPCPEVRDEPAAVPGADNVRRRHGIPLLGALPPDFRADPSRCLIPLSVARPVSPRRGYPFKYGCVGCLGCPGTMEPQQRFVTCGNSKRSVRMKWRVPLPADAEAAGNGERHFFSISAGNKSEIRLTFPLAPQGRDDQGSRNPASGDDPGQADMPNGRRFRRRTRPIVPPSDRTRDVPIGCPGTTTAFPDMRLSGAKRPHEVTCPSSCRRGASRERRTSIFFDFGGPRPEIRLTCPLEPMGVDDQMPGNAPSGDAPG
jgi:hypothetical protein